ncbi:MAG: hypothetical protein GY841_07640 [FCB group bacterium]|nr:hypothetical protein [FCB group bacterium]
MNRLILSILAAGLLVSCQGKVEPAIDAGLDECESCSMRIEHVDHGAVAIDIDENLNTFCSPVCLLMQANKRKDRGVSSEMSVFLFDHINLEPIAASEAFIVHGDFPTAMGHGLLAFGNRADAEQFAAEVDGEVLDWDDLRVRHEIPDLKINIEVPTSDQPPVYEVRKGQIVEVSFGNDSQGDYSIVLMGYDFEMIIPAASARSESFVADRPGQGFVFKDDEGSILANLFVTGDHTAEEATYR